MLSQIARQEVEPFIGNLITTNKLTSFQVEVSNTNQNPKLDSLTNLIFSELSDSSIAIHLRLFSNS